MPDTQSVLCKQNFIKFKKRKSKFVISVHAEGFSMNSTKVSEINRITVYDLFYIWQQQFNNLVCNHK